MSRHSLDTGHNYTTPLPGVSFFFARRHIIRADLDIVQNYPANLLFLKVLKQGRFYRNGIDICPGSERCGPGRDKIRTFSRITLPTCGAAAPHLLKTPGQIAAIPQSF
jgi:hypothetical protein